MVLNPDKGFVRFLKRPQALCLIYTKTATRSVSRYVTHLLTVLIRDDGTSRGSRISSEANTFRLPCSPAAKLDADDSCTSRSSYTCAVQISISVIHSIKERRKRRYVPFGNALPKRSPKNWFRAWLLKSNPVLVVEDMVDCSVQQGSAVSERIKM